MSTALTLLAVVGGMVLVRAGWGGRRALAVVGWTTVFVGVVLLTDRDGAWGLAVGAVVASAAALAIVLRAGWTAPAKAARPRRGAPAIAIPRGWPDIARRVGVFALVVPIAFAAAQWLAFGAQALARRVGAGDADAIVLALFLQPVLWGILMTIQMTRRDAGRMIAPPIVAAVLGTILWSVS